MWRWISADAIRPRNYRSWIFPRDPQFKKKAGLILDLYDGRGEGQLLEPGDYVVCADGKPSIQARSRNHSTQAAKPSGDCQGRPKIDPLAPLEWKFTRQDPRPGAHADRQHHRSQSPDSSRVTPRNPSRHQPSRNFAASEPAINQWPPQPPRICESDHQLLTTKGSRENYCRLRRRLDAPGATGSPSLATSNIGASRRRQPRPATRRIPALISAGALRMTNEHRAPPGPHRAGGTPAILVASRESRRLAMPPAGGSPPLSSRGLGRRPLTAETRVRIPVAVLTKALLSEAFSVLCGPFADQSCESGPAKGRDSARYRRLRDRLALVGRSSHGTANPSARRGPARAASSRRSQREQRASPAVRRLAHAGKTALGSVVVGLLGLAVAIAGAAALGGLLVLTALGLGFCARGWLSLARRSRVGARSEDAVQRALAPLQAEGWRLRHSLPWQGQGDIDSVAIAPSGIAIAIETKTRTYEAHHLARVREQAGWLSRRRRRWARNGALAVMCLVRVRGVERVEDDVLVVSIDRLTHVLRVAAGMGPDARSAG